MVVVVDFEEGRVNLSVQQRLERLKRAKAEKVAELKNMAAYREGNRIEFFDQAPNPGPNPKQAQVLEAFLDPQFKTFGMDGGNRLGKCLTFQTLIDTPRGEISVGKLYQGCLPFEVYAWDGERKVVAEASAPFKKDGFHKCYLVTMKDGRWFEAADDHFVLTPSGWLSMMDVLCTYFQNPRETTSGTFRSVHAPGVSHLSGKASGFQDGCFYYRDPCGEQPLWGQGISQFFVPLQDGVLRHNHSWCSRDVLESKHTNTPFLNNVLPSILDDPDQNEDQFFEFLSHIGDNISSFSSPESRLSPQPSNAEDIWFQPNPATGRHPLSASLPLESPLNGVNNIHYIKSIPTCQEVFDFEVKKYHNYFAGGMVHHNTTILTLLGLSVLFGKYLWNNQSLLHLFPHKNPRKVRYIGQGWHDHIEKVVIPEIIKWWPTARKVENHGNGIIRDTFWQDAVTKGTLEIMSNNQDSKEHEGWAGDLNLYDEPCRREIYVANARGLVDRRGREVFAATLLAEPWIDKEIKKKVGSNGKPDRSVFWVSGTSYDNVGYGITQEGIEELATKLTEGEKQARIYGIPQYMQGLVYPQFSRKEHLFDWFQIPLSWMVDIAIDVHPRERQAVLFVATDPRNDRYICDEIWDYGDGTKVGEEIIRKVNNNSYRVNRIVIDPLSKGDSNNAETTYMKIATVLMRYGFTLETASKDKDTGILEVKKHLKGPNNKPSIFLLDNCVRTLSEIEGYMWDKETNKPVDKDDHMMEDLYRVLLLNTQYIEPEEEMASHSHRSRGSAEAGRNATTGY